METLTAPSEATLIPARETNARQPLYEVVREQLRQQCLSQGGESMLPSLRQLSLDLSVNHITISRALRDLETDGIVQIVPRKGIFVRPQTAPSVEIVTLLSYAQNLSEISAQMFKGMQEVAGQGRVTGTTLRVPPFPDPAEFVRSLRARGCAAMVLLGFSYLDQQGNMEEVNFIHGVAQQIPVVLVGQEHNVLKLNCVYGDPRACLCEFLETCHARGRRRFGYLGADIPNLHMKERFDTFRDFLLDRGIAWDRAYIPTDVASNSDAAARLLEGTTPPDVVIAATLSRAYSLILAAQARGLEPGKDLDVLCFSSSSDEARSIAPYATIALQDEEGVGRAAMTRIKQVLKETPAQTPTTIRIPAKFMTPVPGQSPVAQS